MRGRSQKSKANGVLKGIAFIAKNKRNQQRVAKILSCDAEKNDESTSPKRLKTVDSLLAESNTCPESNPEVSLPSCAVQQIHHYASSSSDDRFNTATTSADVSYFICTAKNRKGDELSSELPRKPLFTPFENQVMELKSLYPGMILMIQNAYKYCFYGEDAEIASKILNIQAVKNHNFVTASIPVTRLHAHIQRLVEQGHKVGVVNQTETAALKASGENKNAPFSRALSNVYSPATLIGDDVNPLYIGTDPVKDKKSTYILSIVEMNTTNSKCIKVGIAAFDPSTGESIYDSFEDYMTRDELEKRVEHIKPVEILVPTCLSPETSMLLQSSTARIEELLQQPSSIDATCQLTKLNEPGKDSSIQTLDLSELPSEAATAIYCLFLHLQKLKLERSFFLSRFKKFTTCENALQLDANVLRNLEIFKNSMGTDVGTLFAHMDNTQTAFGSRLLYKWISQPLRNVVAIEERLDAVTELCSLSDHDVGPLHQLLNSLPDLSRGLTTMLHHRSSPATTCMILESLNFVKCNLEAVNIAMPFNSQLLKSLIADIIDCLSSVPLFLQNINIAAARAGDKTHLLKDFSAYPAVMNFLSEIDQLENQLNQLEVNIAKIVNVPTFSYKTVAGQEYLIEVKRNVKVPPNWRKISETKQLTRFRSPEVDCLFIQLCQSREKLELACNVAWVHCLEFINQNYFKYKKAVDNLAVVDVLLSLASVARNNGYSRPSLTESGKAFIIIENGRHPLIADLSNRDYIPNNTYLQTPKNACMVLSGPNMGGKSSYIRQVALITLMAQMGSYVPATNAKLTIFDAIFTRMGVHDNIIEGQSTFMTELLETSYILKKASSMSLLLIDELGRGTSTCDGAAIAVATLNYILKEISCLCLFVTHYPEVMNVCKEINYHMAFVVSPTSENEDVLTFLYKVTKGKANKSYGINVAHLAGLPYDILNKSKKKADEVEWEHCKYRWFSLLWNSPSADIKCVLQSMRD